MKETDVVIQELLDRAEALWDQAEVLVNAASKLRRLEADRAYFQERLLDDRQERGARFLDGRNQVSAAIDHERSHLQAPDVDVGS